MHSDYYQDFQAQIIIEQRLQAAKDYHLAQLCTHLQVHVPVGDALTLCDTIRRQYAREHQIRKSLICAGCVLLGRHGIPLKLRRSATSYCQCETVAERYIATMRHNYAVNTL